MEILSYTFAILCTTVTPLALSIYFLTRRKGYAKPLFLGTLTFVVFQILTRIPLIQLVLPQTMWYTKLGYNIIAYALFLGITAALFEELGRYLVMKLFLKDKQTVKHSIAFGIGHGGIEAILLVGINYIVALILGISIGSPLLVFIGGAERLFAMAFHIGMSVMVMKSVRENKKLWLIVAIALHTVLDAGVVIASSYGVNILAIELIVLAFAIYAITFTFKELKK